MKIIVGLGNPGEKYQKTRHNLGFMVLDHYAQKHLGPKVSWERNEKFKSEILRLMEDLLLVKPQTYMNNSGMAVESIINFFKLPVEDVIVVYDELDLPLGRVKVRKGGSAAGHHGVESIINELKDDRFIRIRLGIGVNKSQNAKHGEYHFEADKYVLLPFKKNEQSQVTHMIKLTAEILDTLVKKGLEEAQNRYNVK